MTVRGSAFDPANSTHYVMPENVYIRMTEIRDGMECMSILLTGLPEDHAPANRYMAALWASMGMALEGLQEQVTFAAPGRRKA